MKSEPLSMYHRLGFVVILLIGIGVTQIHSPVEADTFTEFQTSPTYLQYQFGFASDADFGPSLLFLVDPSQEHTFLNSLSVGRRLSDTFLGRSIDVIGYIGVQKFDERQFQLDGFGVTLYWKLYRQWSPPRFPTWLPLRIGLGQGLSYVSRIPVAERRDFLPDESAVTVHYLEWSLQIPLSAILHTAGVSMAQAEHTAWIGYSIFHRSTVFGLFAESAGGINYPGISLEVVF